MSDKPRVDIDKTKKVYLIVHGQRQLLDKVKEKLAASGFSTDNMQPASLDRAGSPGEYVAMIWPPMSPNTIVVSRITSKEGAKEGAGAHGMGAWSSVSQQELARIPL
jgi:hypothetical protein